MSGQEGRYKSKTSLLKIELELKKIDWAPRKINLKKQRSNSLMLKFPILERILFKKALLRIKILIFCSSYNLRCQQTVALMLTSANIHSNQAL